MRNYMTISDEEKNSILQSHSSFYNGYATGNVPTNVQPLRVDKSINDSNGITVDNKGNVKTYKNHKINESVISEQEGKGCAESEGGSGCIKKKDGEWVIMNNKKGGIFKKCSSKKDCEEILAGYHASVNEVQHNGPEERDEFDGRPGEVIGVDSNIKKQRKEMGEMEANDMDVSDVDSAYDFDSGGPEQFDSSYTDDSYGLDIDSIMKMFGTDMSPAQYHDEEDMMNGSLDGKEKFNDEDSAYEFDSQGGNAAVYYEEEQCEGCGEKYEEEVHEEEQCEGCGEKYEEEVKEKEICESCGSEMFEGECVQCGSLYEEIDEEIHESFTKNRKQIKEMFNRISRFN